MSHVKWMYFITVVDYIYDESDASVSSNESDASVSSDESDAIF